MLRKKDYEAELAKKASELKTRKDHTREELDAIGRNMPIRVMQSPFVFAKYCNDDKLSMVDSYILFAWISTQFPFLSDVRVSNDISYENACKYYERARVNTIILHRVNYILHDSMSMVYDLLEKDKRFRFGVKKAYKYAEGMWDYYIKEHRQGIEDAAWYTMLHHLSLASDAVSPLMEKVYEAIRDNMIAHRLSDIELRARISVVLLMAKVAGHSFRHFFEDFEKECGADYSKCFSYDNLGCMIGKFAEMCGNLGIPMEKDVNGYWKLKDYDPESCLRFRKSWADFMDALRDDDLMDKTAAQAIEHNPEVSKEYHRVLEKQEEEKMSESISKLSDKFKVKAV